MSAEAASILHSEMMCLRISGKERCPDPQLVSDRWRSQREGKVIPNAVPLFSQIWLSSKFFGEVGTVQLLLEEEEL